MLSLSTVALEAYQRNASWDPKFWVVLLFRRGRERFRTRWRNLTPFETLSSNNPKECPMANNNKNPNEK